MGFPMLTVVIYVYGITQLGQIKGFNVLKNCWAATTSIKEPQPVPDMAQLGILV